jgi:hypothetical protein
MADAVIECLTAISGTDDSLRSLAFERLRSLSADPSIADLFVSLILSNSLSLPSRALCAFVYRHLRIPITETSFPLLLTAFAHSDAAFRHSVIKLISSRISSFCQFEQIMALPEQFLPGQLEILREFLSRQPPDECVNPALIRLVSVIAEDVPLPLKVLAAEGLASLLRFASGEEFVPLAMELFSQPLTMETAEILSVLVGPCRRILAKEDCFELFFGYFELMAEMAPLEGAFLGFAMELVPHVLTLDVEFDGVRVVRATALACVLSEGDIARWSGAIEDFVIENIDLEEGTLRDTVVMLLMDGTLATFVVEVAKEMMEGSAQHQEVAFWLLSSILPANTAFEIDLVPPKDALSACRWLACTCLFGCPVDEEVVARGIAADGFIVPVLTAQAILETNRFDGLVVFAVERLLTFVPMFETEVLADFMDFVGKLVNRNLQLFGHLIEPMIDFWQHEVKRQRVATSAVAILSALATVPDFFEAIGQRTLRHICAALRHPELCEMGMDFLAALYSRLEHSPFDPAVFELFLQAIVSAELSKGMLQAIFPIVALFARSGFAATLIPWFAALLRDKAIPGSHFLSLGTVFLAFFLNSSNEEMLVLVQAIIDRLEEDSIGMIIGIAASLGTMAIVDCSRLMQILVSAEFPLDVLVREIADKFDCAEIYHVERKLIIAGLFQLPPSEFIVYDSLMAVSEFAIGLLVKLTIDLGLETDISRYGIDECDRRNSDGCSTFLADDPFVVSHPFFSLPYTEFVKTVLQGVTIPPRYQEWFVDNAELLPCGISEWSHNSASFLECNCRTR